MNREEVDELIEKGEGQTIEFKESDILGNRFKLAKEMTAFANSEGGTLLIGVKDDRQLEGMTVKKGHEEDIMNIASDKCRPRIYPDFKKVDYSNEADVYVIEIPESSKEDLHEVQHKNKTHYFTRIGSTVRHMKHEEIRKRFEKDKSKQEIPDKSNKSRRKIPIQNNKLRQKVFMKLYRFAYEKLSSKWQHAIFGGMTIGGSISFALSLISLMSNYTLPQTPFLLVIGLFLLVIALPFYLSKEESRCQKCDQYYALEKEASYRVDREKRTGKPDMIKIEDIYKCANCGNTVAKNYWKEEQRQKSE